MSSSSQRQRRTPPAPEAEVPTLAQSVPTLGRRLLAWSLEAAILAGSIFVPLSLGGKVNETAATPSADLTPVLQVAQDTAAKGLGLSPRSLPEKVTPLTNVLWSTALGLPLVLAIAHVYSISRYGRSWPKQWLGVQVLALNGQMPGWRRSLLREGIGKWGGPIVLAYGLWSISGAFPGLVILGGMGILALVGESLTGLGNAPRRPWHDWLAGTCVVDQDTGAIIRLSSLWEEEVTLPRYRRNTALDVTDTHGGLTSVVLNPLDSNGLSRPLSPVSMGLGLGLLLLLGGLVGGAGYYLLGTKRTVPDPEENLYVTLVATLTNPDLDAAARRAAVLALGNLPDDRVTPLLVDLIAQTDDPLWLDALQQALVAQGAEAIPYLRRLNQSLAADLAMQGENGLKSTLILRLQTVNRILTKLILLEEGDRPYPLNLSDLHLGHLVGNQGEFTLVLNKQDLSGTQWNGSILTRAQFQGAKFYTLGQDDHPDTYDDRTADLSGANLTDANLTGADLTLSRLVGVGLLRTTLQGTNLTLADLSRANLEQSRLIQANLRQAQLVEARLAKADLTEADLTEANLEGARLPGVMAAGAQLTRAVLRGTAAQSANFADADLQEAQLDQADFTGALLQGANLRGANLSNAIFQDADLRHVWLQGANLQGVDLAGAIFTDPTTASGDGFVAEVPELNRGNQFVGVDFNEVRNLEPDQLSFICAQGGIHAACDLAASE